jgi:Predicted transcriptional regulators
LATLDENKPIFQQIAEKIENDIVEGTLKEDEQVPSVNQFALHYRINPATAAKGVNVLVDRGVLYKRRGIGMFVAQGARKRLIEERKERFYEDFVVKLVSEARKLGITKQEIIDMLRKEVDE